METNKHELALEKLASQDKHVADLVQRYMKLLAKYNSRCKIDTKIFAERIFQERTSIFRGTPCKKTLKKHAANGTSPCYGWSRQTVANKIGATEGAVRRHETSPDDGGNKSVSLTFLKAYSMLYMVSPSILRESMTRSGGIPLG